MIPFLHIDDAINTTIQSIHWEIESYNIVDDHPVASDEWSVETSRPNISASSKRRVTEGSAIPRSMWEIDSRTIFIIKSV